MGTVDIITSGRPDLTEYAAEYGYLRGARLYNEGEYRIRDVSLDFLDMDWEDPDPEALIKAADHHRPKYVVAGDYLRDEDNVARVNERARDLRRYAENVIVVPKSPGDLQHVPKWCVVGYSVPSDYGGTDIKLRQYQCADQDIHILGGTPHAQFRIIGQLWTDNICSVDGNSIHKAATIGAKAWFPDRPHWRKIHGENAVKRAYRRSITNLFKSHQRRGLIEGCPA